MPLKFRLCSQYGSVLGSGERPFIGSVFFSIINLLRYSTSDAGTPPRLPNYRLFYLPILGTELCKKTNVLIKCKNTSRLMPACIDNSDFPLCKRLLLVHIDHRRRVFYAPLAAPCWLTIWDLLRLLPLPPDWQQGVLLQGALRFCLLLLF